MGGVTETWLCADFEAHILLPSGFTGYRVEKPGRGIGGGVLLLVRDAYLQAEGSSLRTSNIEAVECKVDTDIWQL